MKTQKSFYLSEKDNRKIEKLKKLYDVKSASELIRILIDDEFKRVQMYEEMLEK